MNHSIVAENYSVRLRPVRLLDAPFIVWLRNLDHVKGNVGDSATDITGQEEWLRGYFQCEGDYYFIIETACGTPLGTYGIYDIHEDNAESGRWIVRPEVPAAIPSIVLGFEVAFERMGLRRLRAHTVSTNARVLSLNRKMGFEETHYQSPIQIIDGKPVRLVQFEITAEKWSAVRKTMEIFARTAEGNIRNWEQSFLSKAQSSAPGIISGD